MNMSDGSFEKHDGALNWVFAALCSDVPKGGFLRIEMGGHSIMLYGVDDAYFATDAWCTHGAADLGEGFLEGYEIECPIHQGIFDIRTGKPVAPPCTIPLRTFPTRVVQGRLYIALNNAET